MNQSLRHSGTEIIGDVPWGTHFCQFYQTKEDLMDVLVPYFKAGLENNEFCMWVTSQPLDVEEAKEALRGVVPDIDVYLERGQIEIIPYTQWYVKEGVFDSNRVLNGWVEKRNQALAIGYDGLRLTGNTFWLEKKYWNDFVDYEEEVDRVLGDYHMIALCTYCLDKCNAKEIIDVVVNHQFALIEKEGKWEQIESSKRREAEETAILQSVERKKAEQERERTGEVLQKSEEQYRTLFSTMNEGFCIIEMLFDENEKPIDYIFIEANPAFENQTGLNNVVGKRIRELIPTNEEFWYQIYGKVALTGESVQFENRVESLHRWYEVYAYHIGQPESRKVAILFNDITERKRVEEQIRRQAEELETVMETTPIAIWIGHDPQSHNITGNRMANKFYEAEVGENVSANITPVRRFFCKDRELTADELPMQEASLNNIDVRNVELDVLLASGKRRVILGSASPLHDADGHVRGSIGAFIDITKRKRMEEALHQSEEKYRNIVETTNEGVWVADAEGKTTYLNQKMVEMLGYSLEEVIGKHGWDFADEEYNAISKANMAKRRNGINEVHEFKLIRKDGSPLWALVNSQTLNDEHGKFTGVLAMFTDITERKQMEEALRQSEEKYRNIVEIANEGIWLVDSEIKITYVNKKTADMLGYSQGEMIGRSGMDFVDAKYKAYSELRMEKRQQGIDEVHENKLVRKDGSTLWVLVSSKSLFDTGGKFTGVLSMLTDITERKQADEALRQAYENLQVQSEELQAQSEEIQMQYEELQAQSEELHETYETLRESEEHFHTMANAIPQLAWVAHPDGYIYWYNERWYAYTGTTPEQMEGWGWQSVHDPEVLPKVLG